MGHLHRDLQCSLHFRHCAQATAVVQWNCGRARGPHDRQGKAAGSSTAFCPGRPAELPDRLRLGRYPGARGALPRARPARGENRSRSRCIRAAGAAHHSVPGHAAGPAVGTRQPSGKPSSSPEPTDQGDLVVISIVFIKAVRKGQNGHFSGGITRDSGKWSAPAANEVAP